MIYICKRSCHLQKQQSLIFVAPGKITNHLPQNINKNSMQHIPLCICQSFQVWNGFYIQFGTSDVAAG